MPRQIINGLEKDRGVLTTRTEQTVAVQAQKLPHGPGQVVVINLYVMCLLRSKRVVADCTGTVLCVEQARPFLDGDPVEGSEYARERASCAR